MANKLKYYSLGLIEPKFIPAVWEYSNIVVPECPTIFSYTPNSTAIKMSGYERMDKQIKTENIPSSVKSIRIASRRESNFIVDPNLIGFQFHFPDIDEYSSLVRAVKAIVYKVLRAYEIPLEESGNDIFFIKDGLQKKFFGMMDDPTSDGWRVAVFSITLRFNSELANKICKFEDEKFAKKGKILDLGEIVGGLYEIATDIDRGGITRDIIQMIAERYDLELSEESLPEDELSKMNAFATKSSDKQWVLYGNRD